jgi:hypothetical protein
VHSLRVTAISSRTRAISASRSLRISAIVAKLRLIDSIPDASTSGRSLDDDDDDDPRSEEKKKDMQKHYFRRRGQGVSEREVASGKKEEPRPCIWLAQTGRKARGFFYRGLR